MGRFRSNPAEEFPLLENLGLTTLDINADGNCMFSALSHQIYGHTRKALHIRIAVVNYLREHSAEFKHFINYDGERRSPSRGCTRGRGRYSSTSPAREEVESKVNATWERYLSSMAKQGEWGDNLTLRAFALAFNRSVRVYQKDGEQDISADEERHEMVKIAYHDWRHYSSVVTISTDFAPKSRRFSNTVSPSTSPSSPSGSDNEKPVPTSVRRRRLVARKDHPRFSRSPSTGSSKRSFDSDDEEEGRAPKRLRNMNNDDIPYLSLNDNGKSDSDSSNGVFSLDI